MDEIEILHHMSNVSVSCDLPYRNSPNGNDQEGELHPKFIDHSRHVPSLHTSFQHTGPHRRHMCMVFSMLGCVLLTALEGSSS